MRFRDHKDWRVTLFLPYALVVFILMSIPRPSFLVSSSRPSRLVVHLDDHCDVPDL
jgi:hypothetical protein